MGESIEMSIEVSMLRQSLILLYSIIIGGLLGIVYDTVRIQRVMLGVKYRHKTAKMLKEIRLPFIKNREGGSWLCKLKLKSVFSCIRTLIIFLQDILFFTFSGLCVTIFIYHANYGQIRYFAFFGLVFGFFVYYNTFGRVVMTFSEFIVFFVKVIFTYLWYFISKPTIFLSRLICRFTIGVIWRFAIEIKSFFWSRKTMQTILSDAECGFLADYNIKV